MRKRNISVVVLLMSSLLFVVCIERIHAQSLQWVQTGGGEISTGSTLYTDDDKIFDMKVDNFGNLYSIGRTSKSTYNFNGVSGSVWGAQDMFVMKTRCDGSVAWVKFLGGRASSAGGEYVNALAVDNEGNAYVTASDIIYGTHTSDSSRLGDSTIPYSVVRNDGMIVVKFDSGGRTNWYKTYPSTGLGVADQPLDITYSNADGNIYLLAKSFGGCIPGTDTTDAIYVVKYNTSGSLLCFKKVFDNSPGIINCKIVADPQGHFYLAGTFDNPDSLIVTGGFVLPEPPIYDRGFICKFDTGGVFKWAKYSNDLNAFDDIAINNMGNIIAVCGGGGSRSHPLSIDTFNLINPTGISSTSICVVFDSIGNIKGGNVVGATSSQEAYAIVIDKNDHITIGGDAGAHLSFDGDTMSTRSGDGNDAYFATMSPPSYRFINAQLLRGSGFYDGVNSIAVDGRNNLYLGGYIEGSLYQPGDTFATGIRGGITDIFIGKYGVASCLCNDASASFTESHTGHSFTYNSTSTNADSLFWIFGDGATQAGGATANHTYTTGTPHSVCLWAFNDCSKDSSCLVTTGIEGVSSLNVEIYPNPASDFLQVNNQSDKNCAMDLIDLSGKLMLSSTITQGLNNISLREFGSGIYFIRLSQGSDIQFEKLVIQH